MFNIQMLIMKYYILYYSFKKQEVGSANFQAEKFDKYAYIDWSSYINKPFPENYIFPKYKLVYRAKMTDLLKIMSLGIPGNAFISPKMSAVLEQFKAPPYQLIEAVELLNKKKEWCTYKILHQYIQKNEYVDYSKTFFERTVVTKLSVSNFTTQKEHLQFASFEELRQAIQAKKGNINVKALYLDKEKIKEDFFMLNLPYIWVVNEKVAAALQQAEMTGLALIPLEDGENFCDESVVRKANRLTE